MEPSHRPAADELRHPDAHVEAWWWWGSGETPSGPAGVFVGFELRGRRFDYWAGLVRDGEPYLYVEELDGTDLRRGLEIKPPQMWADHVCDVPWQQWSLGNEAHGVLLDDLTEAWRRAHGTLVPVTFDVEWHATEPPQDRALVAGGHGYEQIGEIDARVELTEGVLSIVGPARRVHVWNVPHLPPSTVMDSTPTPTPTAGLRAPYRRSDGQLVDQWLTPAGEWVDAVQR